MQTYLIVGLGNPGDQYFKTKHNAGFLILDAVAEHLNLQFKLEKKFNSLLSEYRSNSGQRIILLKPLTYMNNSGMSLIAAKNFYKIQISNIIVIHDELYFPFGRINFKSSGGDGGNNGIKSITQHLGANNYLRLRIGIDKPTIPEYNIADYVLSTFTADQLKSLNDYGKIIAKNIDNLFDQGKHSLIIKQLGAQ